MLRSSLLVACVCLTGTAQASSWTEALVPERSKDFGSVPRGTLLVHPFRVVNTTDKKVRVSNLRVSCGCVVAEMEHPELLPGQESTILAKMHTDRFRGGKTVSIYVTLDQPEPG